MGVQPRSELVSVQGFLLHADRWDDQTCRPPARSQWCSRLVTKSSRRSSPTGCRRRANRAAAWAVPTDASIRLRDSGRHDVAPPAGNPVRPNGFVAIRRDRMDMTSVGGDNQPLECPSQCTRLIATKRSLTSATNSPVSPPEPNGSPNRSPRRTLLRDVADDRTYAIDYVLYRITLFRSDRSGTRNNVRTEDLRHDLRLLIEDLSESADIIRHRRWRTGLHWPINWLKCGTFRPKPSAVGAVTADWWLASSSSMAAAGSASLQSSVDHFQTNAPG